MPSRLRESPIDRIPLDDSEDWVRVRRWITAKDRDEINHQLTKVNMEEGTGTYKTENANRVTAQHVLVEWGGPGFCVDDHGEDDDVDSNHEHRPVPITFEAVSMLPDQDLRKIITHISRKNPKAIAPTGAGNGKVAGDPFPEETPAGVS